MEKKELLNLKKLTKEKGRKVNIDYGWIKIVIIATFILSICFSLISEVVFSVLPLIFSCIILLVFIFLGILFDMIGVSVTVCDIEAFNSMASRRVYGAKLAVYFILKKDRVSSFCNDLIGDICGIISGCAGAFITSAIYIKTNGSLILISLLVTAFIASFTIGGKAIGKTYAIKNANVIMYRFSCFLSHFTKK